MDSEHVADRDARPGRGLAGHRVQHLEPRGRLGERHAQPGVHRLAARVQQGQRAFHPVPGDGEVHAFELLDAGEHDARQVALLVQQRTAAVAGIHRHVDLHRVSDLQEPPAGRRDDARGDGALEAPGRTDGVDAIARVRASGSRAREHVPGLHLDLHEGQVEHRVPAEDPRRDPLRRVARQAHVQAGESLVRRGRPRSRSRGGW